MERCASRPSVLCYLNSFTRMDETASLIVPPSKETIKAIRDAVRARTSGSSELPESLKQSMLAELAQLDTEEAELDAQIAALEKENREAQEEVEKARREIASGQCASKHVGSEERKILVEELHKLDKQESSIVETLQKSQVNLSLAKANQQRKFNNAEVVSKGLLLDILSEIGSTDDRIDNLVKEAYQDPKHVSEELVRAVQNYLHSRGHHKRTNH